MSFDSFIAGFAYGITTVIVGQPFEVLKTTLQINKSISLLNIIKQIYISDGFKGFYRGSIPLAIGGGLMRSAQFGFYQQTILFINQNENYFNISSNKIFGYINPHVLIAGFIGGIGRGLVEGPFEYIKVRRIIQSKWKLNEIFSGSGATIFRNSFLFCSFSLYLDISKQLFPNGLNSFITGAVCANLAWLTIWPLDVVKSLSQSGKYVEKSYFYLLKDVFKTGALYRGLLPGLLRSTIANGSSMVVYKKVEQLLQDLRSSS